MTGDGGEIVSVVSCVHEQLPSHAGARSGHLRASDIDAPTVRMRPHDSFASKVFHTARRALAAAARWRPSAPEAARGDAGVVRHRFAGRARTTSVLISAADSGGRGRDRPAVVGRAAGSKGPTISEIEAA